LVVDICKTGEESRPDTRGPDAAMSLPVRISGGAVTVTVSFAVGANEAGALGVPGLPLASGLAEKIGGGLGANAPGAAGEIFDTTSDVIAESRPRRRNAKATS